MKSKKSGFRFKKFSLRQSNTSMKVGTDGVLLGAWCSAQSCNSVLDIGAGTGLIGLMVAQRNPACNITFLEPDPGAVKDLVFNCDHAPFQQRLQVVKGDLQSFGEEAAFDLIVTNPPFFETSPAGATPRASARQMHSLDHVTLLKHASHLLDPMGILSVILPFKEGGDFIDLAGRHGLFISKQCLVYSNKRTLPIRRLIEFRKYITELSQDILYIRNDGYFSEKYLALTREFYLEPDHQSLN